MSAFWKRKRLETTRGNTMRRKICLGLLGLSISLLWGKMDVFEVNAAEVNEVTSAEETLVDGEVDTEDRKVRVGWFESEGYFEEDQNGNLSGFGIDYLNAIASYTGWEYEFVEGTRAECLTMLQNGTIDILSPVRIDLELENAKVSSEVIGESYGYIYKLGNNFRISYEEYNKFNRLIIGIEKGTGIEKEVKAYCAKNDFQFYDIVYFDTMDEMKKELAGKKIDAIVADSYVNIENLKVIGRFSNGLVTFAVSDDTLWNDLNHSIENIKLDNPEFTEDLRNRYFSESSQTNLEYSVEERMFLSIGRRYDVALSTEQYPISYKTTEEIGQKGIAVDILKKMEYYSGITFNIVYVDSYEEAEEMLRSGEVDILGGNIVGKQDLNNVSEVFNDTDNDMGREYTAEFYDMEMAFIGRKGTKMEDSLRVAVPPYMNKCISELQVMYPKYEFVVLRSDDECLEAILNNEVDAAVQSDLKINELTIYDKYKELQNLKFIPGNYSAAFTICTEDTVLVNIMNKTLNSISDMSLATIENNNIQHIAMEQMSVKEFILRYRGYIVLSVVLFSAINVAGFGYRKYKEEQKSKEKAYRDSIANISSMEKFRIDAEPILSSDNKLNYYLISIDVDQFKLINDLFGYEQGDQVIAYLAKALQNGLGKDSLISRSNADCFIILKKAGELAEVEQYLVKVFEKVEVDVEKYSGDYRIILKAGIYKIREEDFVLSSIMDKATMAKTNMEIGHESSFALYSEAMRQRAIEEKKMENDMEKALETGQFKVYLQPQVDLKTKKIVSAEALVRWIDPEKGIIPPFKFIPLFEKNGFISKLDYYMWEEIIKMLARWRKDSQIMVPISINLSRVDIQKIGMIEELMALFEKYSVPTKWVKAELTESVCLENDNIIMDKMMLLKKHGLKIAIDDFGSGYSSLHMLKEMPIDILKIDKSFLEYNGEMQEKDEILIRDVVELGKHLRMQIIVEGVETLEQCIFLEGIGCDIAQGYYYGRPMPIEEFEVALENNYKVEG